ASVCDSELGAPGWREPLDCVRASELCNQNSQCSSRYRIMRQCLSGGDKERSAMLASKECQGALEVLQDSPLYDCRCKRGMKKELQCLQNYWSIHMGLTEGKTRRANDAPAAARFPLRPEKTSRTQEDTDACASTAACRSVCAEPRVPTVTNEREDNQRG
ncbi:GDNF family receptor alpha-2-like, partial [Plectropomus leopardus]|uniref:GDNF family receptor alpha-2-like n=1 Tax=Plectropomus leopardus TaxID=160734 RepID=UPI001C4B568B